MRDFFRRISSKLGPHSTPLVARKGNNSVQAEEGPFTLQDRRELQQQEARAKSLELAGRRDEAVELFHAAAEAFPSATSPLVELSRIYYQLGDFNAAREANEQLFSREPTNLDALENFIELNYLAPGPAGSTTKALTTLAELLPAHAPIDAEAAVYLLPSMKLMEPADQAIRRLKYSEDLTAQYISRLSTEPESLHEDLEDPSSELRDALVVVRLVEAKYGAISAFLQTNTGAAPLRALATCSTTSY
jgi:tetratricopeptide (TPR) repeat protein